MTGAAPAPGPGPAGPSGHGRLVTAAAAVLLVCAAALTASTSYVLYRTGRAMESLQEATAKLSERLDRIGEKGERVAGSAAGVAEEVEKLAHKIDGLTDRMDFVEGWGEALRGGGPASSAEEGRLIEGLLGAVRDSGLRFVRADKEKSALSMYSWLYAKYRIWKPTVTSADDFIAKVASESLSGAPYQVIGKDGARSPLADWLRGRLAELRRAPAPPSETPAGEK